MYRDPTIRSSEITPEALFRARRQFLRSSGLIGAAAMLGACGVSPALTEAPAPTAAAPTAPAPVDELGDPANSQFQISNYNNFYEFSMGKEEVAELSAGLRTDPWSVEIGGLVRKPLTLGVEDLLGRFDQEERVYRLRCVEAWSMVIPWQGFTLQQLLDLVEPTAEAKYVKFTTLYDPEQMPGQRDRWFDWPYVEGLRLDEARHDLTLLATGIYGQPLLPQNGAPIRLVVPWKYGFKSIKSIVKIELTAEQPVSLWMAAAPQEYGFYANVNPEVNHPRWSQATERRIGEIARRPTLPFNGYAEQVAALYAGQDLSRDY
jgi:methionine sulfoxide reductase catalytic subunit